MILQGRNLIITTDGKVLAGAKSCDVTVQCDMLETASPSTGRWKTFLAGRKEWSLTTNHLVPAGMVPTYTFEAVGAAHNGASFGESYCTMNGSKYAGGSRGLTIRVFEWDSDVQRWQSLSPTTYDTYGETQSEREQAIDDMIAALNDTDFITVGNVVVITSCDAYSMTSGLAQAISTKLGIPVSSIPVMVAGRHAFACVGKVGSGGIAFTNPQSGSTVHAKLMLDNQNAPLVPTPVKDILTKPGTSFTISMQVDGLDSDRLTGSAICQQAKVTATLGNLLQGSFSFKGSGALE